MPFLFSTHFTITSLNREFSGQSIGFALGAVCKKMSTINVRVEHIYILYVIWNFQDTHMSALPARESREGFKGSSQPGNKTKTVKTECRAKLALTMPRCILFCTKGLRI